MLASSWDAGLYSQHTRSIGRDLVKLMPDEPPDESILHKIAVDDLFRIWQPSPTEDVMSAMAQSAVRIALLLLGMAIALAPPLPQALAQPWPQRTVKLIVPLPPGTGTDIAGRLLAERLAERWTQPVVVENRQGGDGIPAVTAFLSARDTHTLLLSFAGIITINPLIHERLPYDPAADLVPLVQVSENFLGVAASATLKVGSLAELIRAARAQPGKLNWAATPGLPYYIVLALQKSAGIEMVPVAYRDFAPAAQDLATGRLHVAATGVPPLLASHQAGTAKLLFVTNRERSPQVLEVPTASEAGHPDLTFGGSIGLFGWRDMPIDIRERIVRDVQTIAADPAFRSRVAAGGTVSRSGTSAEFAAAIEEQRSKIAVIHRAFARPLQ
jgi:tripartite-type tricarboxylate transporter receptor subunit TctC